MTAVALVALACLWPTYRYGRRRGFDRHACITLAAIHDQPPRRSVPVRCQGCHTVIECEVSVAFAKRDGALVPEPRLDLSDLRTHRWLHEGKP